MEIKIKMSTTTRFHPEPGISELANNYLNEVHTTQLLWDAYWSVATSNSVRHADGQGRVYKAARNAVKAAIETTYEMSALKAERVIQHMIDTGELNVIEALRQIRRGRS